MAITNSMYSELCVRAVNPDVLSSTMNRMVDQEEVLVGSRILS